MNVVLVQGVLARAPEEWVGGGGEHVLSFEVAIREEGTVTETVPVRWEEPPSWATELDQGAEVVVTGRVRRRFFRAGGGTQSRTEVIAGNVMRIRAGRRGRKTAQEAVGAALLAAGLLPGSGAEE